MQFHLSERITLGTTDGTDIIRKAPGQSLRRRIRGGQGAKDIVPDIDENDLAQLAERTRQFIERSFFMLDDKHHIAVTASLGVAMALPEDTQETLINRVDALMYQSKSVGRNRVTLGRIFPASPGLSLSRPSSPKRP